MFNKFILMQGLLSKSTYCATLGIPTPGAVVKACNTKKGLFLP